MVVVVVMMMMMMMSNFVSLLSSSFFFFPALSSDKLAINWPGSKTFLLIKAEAI